MGRQVHRPRFKVSDGHEASSVGSRRTSSPASHYVSTPGKRDPAHPVRLVVDGIEIELRRPPESGVIQGAVDQSNLGDRIAAIGPWQGESTDELVEILRRGGDDSARKLPDLL